MSSRLHDILTEHVIRAQSESPEIKLKALQALASLTRVSPQNRNELAQTDGAISTLLTLSKTSSAVQILSLSILFNLSLNTNLKKSLAEMETMQSLNSIILSSTTPDSCKLAASLVCSLAMLDKNKAGFGVAGTIQALIKAIAGSRCPDFHHLLSSLAELVQFHGNCTLAVRAGAVPMLLRLVVSTDSEDLVGTSLAILGLLGRYEEGVNTIRNTDGIVSLLVDVLKRRSMLSKEGSLSILLRLFEESEGCVRDASRLPEFSSLLADLSVRGSTKAREKAGMLMKKMMEANLDSSEESPLLINW